MLYRVAHIKECGGFATKVSVEVGVLDAIEFIGADVVIRSRVSEMKLLLSTMNRAPVGEISYLVRGDTHHGACISISTQEFSATSEETPP